MNIPSRRLPKNREILDQLDALEEFLQGLLRDQRTLTKRQIVEAIRRRIVDREVPFLARCGRRPEE